MILVKRKRHKLISVEIKPLQVYYHLPPELDYLFQLCIYQR